MSIARIVKQNAVRRISGAIGSQLVSRKQAVGKLYSRDTAENRRKGWTEKTAVAHLGKSHWTQRETRKKVANKLRSIRSTEAGKQKLRTSVKRYKQRMGVT